ncbi:MAG: YigZ family protein [Clostridiaceae bacterium]|nr:YigZ family protein [Clostridiaceae bacterium]
MSYLTIKDTGKFEFEEKKSVFIGETIRVETEMEAKEFLNKIKRENKEARHNVYAYILGENNGIQRYSDDGEPQGTGGMPILEVIKRNNLTDIIVVVTRYFGGILLGTGGLTRAYTKAAAESIKQATTVEKVKGCELIIKLQYELLGKVQHCCQLNNWFIETIVYTDNVELLIFCEINNAELIMATIKNITSARCLAEITGEGIYFKNEEKLYKL